MSIRSETFGKTAKGETVTKWTMTNSHGNSISVLDWGCLIQSIKIKDKHQNIKDIVMGFDQPEDYERAGGFIGATIGRCANRIVGGTFTLEGEQYHLFCNEGKNHLHGGKEGFHKKMWNCIPNQEENRLRLSYMSPDGEEGYPGNLWVTITLTWTENNELIFETSAISDKTTVFNLTNHSYFDLNGEFTEESACEQLFWSCARFYTPVDEHGIVNGELRTVKNTVFDFNEFHEFKSRLEEENLQLKSVGGFDHNLVFDCRNRIKAILKTKDDSFKMEFETDSPGIQLYSGNYLRNSVGKGKKSYGKRSGICIEPQYFPNSINLPQFASPVLIKEHLRRQKTIYRFIVN